MDEALNFYPAIGRSRNSGRGSCQIQTASIRRKGNLFHVYFHVFRSSRNENECPGGTLIEVYIKLPFPADDEFSDNLAIYIGK